MMIDTIATIDYEQWRANAEKRKHDAMLSSTYYTCNRLPHKLR